MFRKLLGNWLWSRWKDSFERETKRKREKNNEDAMQRARERENERLMQCSYQLLEAMRTHTHPVQSAPNYEQRCALKGYAKDFQRVKAAKTHTHARRASERERERVVERIDNNQYWMQMVLVSTKPSSLSEYTRISIRLWKVSNSNGAPHIVYLCMFNFKTVCQQRNIKAAWMSEWDVTTSSGCYLNHQSRTKRMQANWKRNLKGEEKKWFRSWLFDVACVTSQKDRSLR